MKKKLNLSTKTHYCCVCVVSGSLKYEILRKVYSAVQDCNSSLYKRGTSAMQNGLVPKCIKTF